MTKLTGTARTLQKLLMIYNPLKKKSHTNFTTPDIYVITPTYEHWAERAELTRVLQAFRLSSVKILWLLIEDRENGNSQKISNFRQEVQTTAENIHVVLLNAKTPNGTKHRGVMQRNTALDYLGSLETLEMNVSAPVYFADDDNTYHSLLLQELTQIPENFTVGMLPVGLDGGMKWAGPICKDGVLVDYYAMWGPNRTFMMDMAGFAIKLSAFLSSNARFDGNVDNGHLETSILEQVLGQDKNKRGLINDEIQSKVKMLADCCTKIYVWHTKTAKPWSYFEGRYRKDHPVLEA